MVFANPASADYVSGAYYAEAGSSYYLLEAKLESDYADVRFERELRLFRRFAQRGAVLDVGCSSGAFLYQLQRRFGSDYQVLGTDVSGPPLDFAEQKGVAVIRGDFPEHDFGDRRFDAITFWAVLEHLADPGRFLDKAKSLLKAEGLVFVLVPNFRSLATRLLGVRYRYIYPQHLNYFTRETLSHLVEPRFTVVKCAQTHFNPIVIWQDWRNRGRTISNQERANLLQKTTAYKQRKGMAPLRLVYRLAEKGLSGLGLADNLVMVLRNRRGEGR